MKNDQYGQVILDEDDLVNLALSGRDINDMQGVFVDDTVNIERAVMFLEKIPDVVPYKDQVFSREEFDYVKQHHWLMPESYRTLDIAEYVLSLCENQEQLQRVGEELLLYQEHDLFDLLKYLKYLVDVMTENKVIWGVGRGSSVSSYVLFKLGVHRVDSMFYELDIAEFLR